MRECRMMKIFWCFISLVEAKKGNEHTEAKKGNERTMDPLLLLIIL